MLYDKKLLLAFQRLCNIQMINTYVYLMLSVGCSKPYQKKKPTKPGCSFTPISTLMHSSTMISTHMYNKDASATISSSGTLTGFLRFTESPTKACSAPSRRRVPLLRTKSQNSSLTAGPLVLSLYLALDLWIFIT